MSRALDQEKAGSVAKGGKAETTGDSRLTVLQCWQPLQAGQLVVLLAQDAAPQLRQKT